MKISPDSAIPGMLCLISLGAIMLMISTCTTTTAAPSPPPIDSRPGA